ncbi:MAG: leucine-rich repeat domain-containing protein [Ruminococcus sp.]|nr:leucine-rich repeat domain-containing protein [Ruminococcus sp.]
MKRVVAFLTTLILTISTLALSVSATDSEAVTSIDEVLYSSNIPYSQDIYVAEDDAYSIAAVSTANFTGALMQGNETVLNFEVALDEDSGWYMLTTSEISLTAGTYTFKITSFSGGSNDLVAISLGVEESVPFEAEISADSVPFSGTFEVKTDGLYSVYIGSPVDISGRIVDSSGNTIYDYDTYLMPEETDYYMVYDALALTAGEEYTFSIDSKSSFSSDEISVMISATYLDENDLYYVTLKSGDLPIEQTLSPQTTGNYYFSIECPENFTAVVTDSSGEEVASFEAEESGGLYSLFEALELEEGESYILSLKADGDFDGRMSVYVFYDVPDEDCMLDVYLSGSDVPTSYSFVAPSDQFCIVNFTADDRLTWRLVDENGNEIAGKLYDPYTSSYTLIKIEEGVTYTLYLDSYEGNADDEINAYIYATYTDDEDGVYKLLTAAELPNVIELTADDDEIYFFYICAPSEFSGSIIDSSGNVVATLSSELQLTYDYKAWQYAYLTSGETYTVVIDEYSGASTDAILAYYTEEDLEAAFDNIFYEYFLYSDFDEGDVTFEVTPDESRDYTLEITSPQSVDFIVTDSSGNVLIEACTSTTDDNGEEAVEYLTLEAGETYTITLSGYDVDENGIVTVTIYETAEFEFEYDERNIYIDGEKSYEFIDMLVRYGGSDTDVYVPLNDCEYAAIGSYAFENKNVEIVTLDEGYEVICPYAFLNCTELTEVNLPDSLSTIQYGAFLGCTSLTSITLGSDIQIIEPYALGYDSDYNKIEGFTIYGYTGTAAEEYAIENGFTFVDVESITESTEETEETESTEETEDTTLADDIDTTVTTEDSEQTVTTADSTTSTTAEVQGTKATNSTTTSGSSVNTGTKSYVVVIFIVVLVVLAAAVVIQIIRIKKDK